jgi:hypothetical protein
VILDFEILSPDDKPALLALSTPGYVAAAMTSLTTLGYKVHVARDHEDFLLRFSRIQYPLVLFEEQFACPSPGENTALFELQRMPMNLRRHAVTLLIGSQFQTLHPLQAFQQSVHAVINQADLDKLAKVLPQLVFEQEQFLRMFRDTERRLAAA